jgi:D-amino-acid oxidase
MLTTPSFIFIVPRNESILYVGGFSEPHEKEQLKVKDPKVDRIAQHATAMFKGDEPKRLNHLNMTHRDTAYPLAQGLRPARFGDVRCEREPTSGSKIVHSYGHAGSGWSLAFGCALDVKVLIEEIIREVPPQAMSHAASSVISQEQVGRFVEKHPEQNLTAQ